MKHNQLICAFIFSSFFLTIAIGEHKPVDEPDLMCGPNVLWLAAKSYGVNTTLQKLRYYANTDKERGTSLNGMLTALKSIGLDPVVVQADWKGLKKLKSPAIALFVKNTDIGHYVFLQEIRNNSAFILDPPYTMQLSEEEFSQQYYGIVIIPSKKNMNMDTGYFNGKNIIILFFIIVLFCLLICKFKLRTNQTIKK